MSETDYNPRRAYGKNKGAVEKRTGLLRFKDRVTFYANYTKYFPTYDEAKVWAAKMNNRTHQAAQEKTK